eukprot:scaffold218772_cov33-Tisochrysis_lutea.AAC.4
MEMREDMNSEAQHIDANKTATGAAHSNVVPLSTTCKRCCTACARATDVRSSALARHAPDSAHHGQGIASRV